MRKNGTFKVVCTLMIVSALIGIAIDLIVIVPAGGLNILNLSVNTQRFYLSIIVYVCSILSLLLEAFAGYYGHKYYRHINRTNTLVLFGVVTVMSSLVGILASAMINLSVINTIVHIGLLLVPVTYLICAIQLTKSKEVDLELA